MDLLLGYTHLSHAVHGVIGKPVTSSCPVLDRMDLPIVTSGCEFGGTLYLSMYGCLWNKRKIPQPR